MTTDPKALAEKLLDGVVVVVVVELATGGVIVNEVETDDIMSQAADLLIAQEGEIERLRAACRIALANAVTIRLAPERRYTIRVLEGALQGSREDVA